MSSPYQAAVKMAAAILLKYEERYGATPFPTVKGQLWPIIEYYADINGVSNVYIKRFKEKMLPIAGQVRRLTEANGVYQGAEQHGIIYLCPSLDLEWQRFIQVKESGHLCLDKPSDYVHSDTDVDNLLLCLAQFGRVNFTKQFESEMRAVVFATELLFPKKTRDALAAKYAAGGISPSDISKSARIPVENIRSAMSDEYRNFIDPLY